MNEAMEDEDYLKKNSRKKYRKSEVKEAINGSGGLMKNVAKRLQCSLGTVREYLDRNQDLQELMVQEMNATKDMANDIIIEAIRNGDVVTAKWYLEYQQKNGYKADSQKIQVCIVDDMD